MRRRMKMRVLTMAVAVVALASAVGTSRYLWCESMQEARMGCCCPDFGSQDVVRAPCCELRELVVLDGARGGDDAPRVFAALPAVRVAELGRFEPSARASTRGSDTLARAGPSSRVHAQYSVYLL